jgi:opacity protein-like surface antigen
MKRIVITVMVMMLAMSSAVYAEQAAEHAAEHGTEVEAGIKMNYNKWKQEYPDGISFTSDDTLLIGPAVEVKFANHIFIGASYLVASSDYNFSDAGMKFSRNEFEAAVGYMIAPQFGVQVGYKNAESKLKDADWKMTDSGPYAGILGNVIANKELIFYGKLNYLMTRSKVHVGGAINTTTSEDFPGWCAEIGAKYAFNAKVSGTLGYQMEATEGKDSKDKNTFSGVTLGAMYAF